VTPGGGNAPSADLDIVFVWEFFIDVLLPGGCGKCGISVFCIRSLGSCLSSPGRFSIGKLDPGFLAKRKGICSHTSPAMELKQVLSYVWL
jgi:hypothetical protein